MGVGQLQIEGEVVGVEPRLGEALRHVQHARLPPRHGPVVARQLRTPGHAPVAERLGEDVLELDLGGLGHAHGYDLIAQGADQREQFEELFGSPVGVPEDVVRAVLPLGLAPEKVRQGSAGAIVVAEANGLFGKLIDSASTRAACSPSPRGARRCAKAPAMTTSRTPTRRE